MTNSIETTRTRTNSAIARLANRFGVEPAKLLHCLTTQVFKQNDGSQPSNEELMVLLLVCENYGLNPFNREIFAFKGKGGDIVPVVSLDGWARIVRNQKDFNGMNFTFSQSTIRIPGVAAELPEYVECAMKLKGIDEPIRVQEYMVECFNDRSPVWKRWPRRMLRTRAFIQCARLAFSLTGLYDEAEPIVATADDVVEGTVTEPTQQIPAEPVKERLPLGKEKLEAMVGKLIYCATNRENGWQRAYEWIDQNLADVDKPYATQALKAEEAKLTTPAESVTVTEDGEVICSSDEAKGGAS